MCLEHDQLFYAIFLGVSSPWVTLELLFGKKYRTLEIMKHEMRNEMKQTMAMKSNNKTKTEGRGTREGASSLVNYKVKV